VPAGKPGSRGWTGIVTRKQVVHAIADTVAQIVTDGAHIIEPDDKGIAVRRRELTGNIESLFEHAEQGIEVAFTLAELVGETGCTFAVTNH
jgi:hypothetical protein